MSIKDCGNCYKSIIASNFITHEAYCHRHFTYCESCKETIRKNEIMFHNQKFHALKKCHACYTVLEAVELPSHISSCKSANNYQKGTLNDGIAVIRDNFDMENNYSGVSLNQCRKHENVSKAYIETYNVSGFRDNLSFKPLKVTQNQNDCGKKVAGVLPGLQIAPDSRTTFCDRKPVKKIRVERNTFDN